MPLLVLGLRVEMREREKRNDETGTGIKAEGIMDGAEAEVGTGGEMGVKTGNEGIFDEVVGRGVDVETEPMMESGEGIEVEIVREDMTMKGEVGITEAKVHEEAMTVVDEVYYS